MEIVDCGVFFGPYQERGPIDPRVETILGILKEAGIAKALVTSLIGIYYSSVVGNRLTLDVCKAYPDIFIPMASVPPKTFQPKTQSLRHLKTEGFKGVGLFPYFQPPRVESHSFVKVAQEADKEGLPIFVCYGWRDGNETSEASRIIRLFNSVEIKVPVILRLIGSIYGGYVVDEYLSLGTDFPNVFFDVGQLNACGCIEILVDKVGADRLVFGSNIPFNYVMSPLLLLKTAVITEAQRRQIASETILKVLDGKWV